MWTVYNYQTGEKIGIFPQGKKEEIQNLVEIIRKHHNKLNKKNICHKKLRGYLVRDCLIIIRNDGILWAIGYDFGNIIHNS